MSELQELGQYPRAVRDAVIKYIACNAPVAVTVDDRYVCVSCGDSPVNKREDRKHGVRLAENVVN